MIKCCETFSSLSYPHHIIRMVFVDECYDISHQHCIKHDLCIFSNNLLFDEQMIDQMYETTAILAKAIITSFLQSELRPLSAMSDVWIMYGLLSLFYEQWVSFYEGKNVLEYEKARFRLQRPDTGPHSMNYQSRPPLSWNGFIHEEQIHNCWAEYFDERSMLVLQVLRQMMGIKIFHQHFVCEVLNGHQLSAYVFVCCVCVCVWEENEF